MKNRYISIFVGIFLAIVFTLLGVLGIAAGIKAINTVVKYDKITIDEPGVNYLCAYYKSAYFNALKEANIEASNTPEFWASISPYSNTTYGEHFEGYFREYVAKVTVMANAYQQSVGYTADDKLIVAADCKEILENDAENSVAVFNTECEKYGFNFNDFQNVAALLYKANKAQDSHLEDGESLESLIEKVEFRSSFENIDLLSIPPLDKFIVCE